MYEAGTERATIKLLANLGKTPGEVAARLAKRGHIGRRGLAAMSPVAIYLSGRLARRVCVDEAGAWIARNGEVVAYAQLPEPVREFMAAYLEGAYGHLNDGQTPAFQTPWGVIDEAHQVETWLWWVMGESDSGLVMTIKDARKNLTPWGASPAAQEGEWLCYGTDLWPIVLFEKGYTDGVAIEIASRRHPEFNSDPFWACVYLLNSSRPGRDYLASRHSQYWFTDDAVIGFTGRVSGSLYEMTLAGGATAWATAYSLRANAKLGRKPLLVGDFETVPDYEGADNPF